MPVASPFFFAWCDSDQTTWGAEHLVMDEYIFGIRRTLAEGQKPLLELEIKNPHVGMLNPASKVWAWLAYDDGDGALPIFFGRLVGNPVQLLQEVVVIQLIADPLDYKWQKQMLAKPMKVLPFWDPVFIPENQRDDPDKILEGYGNFWDIDCVTHEVAAVGFTDAYDGNVDLTDDDHFYDSMDTTLAQSPATVIQMDATVQWTQTARGVAGSLGHAHTGLTDTIRTAWPKSNTQIGDGWTVLNSFAHDVLNTDAAESKTVSYSWQNTAKHKHANGDNMSMSYSSTTASGPIVATYKTSETWQTGVIDPYAVDAEGDPAPLNIPESYNMTGIAVLSRASSMSMTLQYDAARPRTERVIFRIWADTQPILVDPETDEESELITMHGADVGVPLLDVLNWTSVAEQEVMVGQVIFPDDPQMPGGRTAQIAIVGGTAGSVPPDFSDIPEFETVDGEVTWSSLGGANLTTYADWSPVQQYSMGTVICPSRRLVITYQQLLKPGAQAFPPAGASVTPGLVVQASNLSYQQCLSSGITSTTEPAFGTSYGGTVNDGAVSWLCLGMTLPTGMTLHICTVAGISGEFPPSFNASEAGETTDGSVTWVNLGVGGGAEIPIGGVPGQVWAPTYFCTERGHRSLEYLALLVRAKHLWRARCVDMSFDVAWSTGLDINTRKTVTLHDPRLAGGLAVGKVKSAILSFSDNGAAVCRVTIGCLVGKDNAVTSDAGTPDYVDEAYVNIGYQKYSNVLTLLPTGSDLNYAPPSYIPTDDGLTFPLDLGQALVAQRIGGGNDAALLSNIQRDASNSMGGPFGNQMDESAFSGSSLSNTATGVPASAEGEAAWVEFELKPVNAGPFHSVFHVAFSDLTMAKGIDLQSEVGT